MKFPPNIQAPRRTGAFSLVPFSLFILVTLGSFWVATQWVAAHLAYQPRLGDSWLATGSFKLYPPWAIFPWEYWYSSYAPPLFQRAFVICAVGPIMGAMALILRAVWAARKARPRHDSFAPRARCRPPRWD